MSPTSATNIDVFVPNTCCRHYLSVTPCHQNTGDTNFKNRNSEVLHSSSTLISLGCDELDESSNAKERVQFLLSHVCKEEFIFYCLKTQKESERFHLYQKPVSRDQRLQIIQDQLDQMIKVG